MKDEKKILQQSFNQIKEKSDKLQKNLIQLKILFINMFMKSLISIYLKMC